MNKFLILFVPFLFAYCTATNVENPSFAQDIQPIFTSSCATSLCHASATTTNANLNLSEGSAYDAIVNVPSTQAPSIKRVFPGDAANSYLYMKVTAAPGISGVQMPKVGFLSQNQIDAIANWINQGALNN